MSRTLELQLVNEISEVNRAACAVCDFLSPTPSIRRDDFPEAIPETICRKIQVALDELLANIIHYAYPEGGKHTILLRVTVTASDIQIVLRDRGRPFNPFDHPEPDTTLPLEQRDIGGLGILLVRRLMDETHYAYVDGYNQVTLICHYGGTYDFQPPD